MPVTLKVWGPVVAVSIALPFATVPVHVATPESLSLQEKLASTVCPIEYVCAPGASMETVGGVTSAVRSTTTNGERESTTPQTNWLSVSSEDVRSVHAPDSKC